MIDFVHHTSQRLPRQLVLVLAIAVAVMLVISAAPVGTVAAPAQAAAVSSSSRSVSTAPRSPAATGAQLSLHLPLDRVQRFGSNPGNLRMWEYLPDGLPAAAPLVVVLHGCGSSPFMYDDESGWTTVADAWKVALVFPEQSMFNNPSRCFNWFLAEDTSRDSGEALSIRQMADWMVAHRGLDADRIFVTGISAGGAMTSAMLAAYPEIFAGGAPIAGMPYGCAHFPPEAVFCGQPGRDLEPAVWGDRVRAQTGWQGPWPKVSIWQGTHDGLVNPMNLNEMVEQWTDVHGIDRVPELVAMVAGHKHTVFADDTGTPLVESYLISGMTHAQPVNPGARPDQCGVPGPFIEDVGLCAAYQVAVFWGIAKS